MGEVTGSSPVETTNLLVGYIQRRPIHPFSPNTSALARRYLKQSEKQIPQNQLAAEVENLLTEGGRTNEKLRGKVKGAKQLDLEILLQGLKAL